MSENVMKALEIMGSGMVGIFVAIIVIIALVWVLQKLDSVGSKKDSKEA